MKGASCLVPGAWCAWVRGAGRVPGAGWVLGAWCLTGAGCAASAAPPAGAITIALMNAPTNLDPRVGSDEASQKLHQLLYNGLLRIDDQLRVDAATVSREETQRRRLYGEAQKRIAADAPYIGLWHRTNVAVSQPNLEGIRLSPIADFSFLKDVARR